MRRELARDEALMDRDAALPETDGEFESVWDRLAGGILLRFEPPVVDRDADRLVDVDRATRLEDLGAGHLPVRVGSDCQLDASRLRLEQCDLPGQRELRPAGLDFPSGADLLASFAEL